MGTAALQHDFLSSEQIAAKPISWWDTVLGVVGFERAPRLERLQVPLTATSTPTLGLDADLCEVWRSTGGIAANSSAVAFAYGRVQLRWCEDFLFGCMTIQETAPAVTSSAALLHATETAYRQIFAIIEAGKHRFLIRVWNYLPDINRESDGDERYRHFNSARQAAFRNAGRSTVGSVPAASALGSPAGSPICIYFLAATRPAQMIENPRQTSAYHYPAKFGVNSPIFSRACLLNNSAGTNLFVSGTASIVGHETLHRGNVAAQTSETLANIEALVLEANRMVGEERYSLDGLNLKVYVRHVADLADIQRVLSQSVRAVLPVVYLQADVCRDDLLVEIEATGVGAC